MKNFSKPVVFIYVIVYDISMAFALASAMTLTFAEEVKNRVADATSFSVDLTLFDQGN